MLGKEQRAKSKEAGPKEQRHRRAKSKEEREQIEKTISSIKKLSYMI